MEGRQQHPRHLACDLWQVLHVRADAPDEGGARVGETDARQEEGEGGDHTWLGGEGR